MAGAQLPRGPILINRNMVVGNGENFEEDTEKMIEEDPDETSMVRYLNES